MKHMRTRIGTRFFGGRGPALAALILAAALFCVVSSPVLAGATATARELPVSAIRRDDRAAALSFDAAGPGDNTPALIGALAVYRVRATFFVTGDWADRHPEAVRALAAAGHEVMNNSDSYAHFPRLTVDGIVRDVSACNGKIAALTGVVPTLFRCPYGDYDDHVVRVLRSMGMLAIQWDVDSRDWKGLSADQIARQVGVNVRPGSIVLFRVGAPHTVEALPTVIENLFRNGFAVVPVSRLLPGGDVTVDGHGRVMENFT